jgi:uncharacterized protein YndB with AHSA1/START domain
MSYGINHQAGVKASPEEIYKALTETEKLAQWWTTDTRGSGAKVGDTLEFWFYGHCHKFNVKELEPGKRVAWKSPKCQGADEWQETEVTFDLSTDEKQTFNSVSALGLERGKGRPYPYDLEVHWR